MLRRDRGGPQSQIQGLQEGTAAAFKLRPFLNFQYKAGPETQRAETTANNTKQHLTQFPDRLVISLNCTMKGSNLFVLQGFEMQEVSARLLVSLFSLYIYIIYIFPSLVFELFHCIINLWELHQYSELSESFRGSKLWRAEILWR